MTVESNSKGLTLSSRDWLAHHFDACRESYLEQVRAVPWPRSGRVLDAGGGTGLFVPLLAERCVEGPILLLDLADESLSIARAAFDGTPVGSRLEYHAGSVVDLPFEDASVDALWMANVIQYLSRPELEAAIREATRVVRPGGVVAIKEWDPRCLRVPGPQAMAVSLIEVSASLCARGAGTGIAVGLAGARHIDVVPELMIGAGLSSVSAKTSVSNFVGPQDPSSWPARVLRVFAEFAISVDSHVDGWQRFLAADAPVFRGRGFWFAEGSTVSWGRR